MPGLTEAALLTDWNSRWDDLVSFDVVPISKSTDFRAERDQAGEG